MPDDPYIGMVLAGRTIDRTETINDVVYCYAGDTLVQTIGGPPPTKEILP